MDKIFISELTINKVRHLKNITIPLSNEKAKHLIFTGKTNPDSKVVMRKLKALLRRESAFAALRICRKISDTSWLVYFSDCTGQKAST